jgi:DNA-binding NtrC family response regulator
MNASPVLVLLVDNDAALTYVIEKTLAALGVEVMTAHTAETAFVYSRQHQFSLVITDFRLNDANGVALLKLLRQKAPDFPAVIYTAYYPSVREIIRDDAITRIVSKNEDIDALLDAARQLVPIPLRQR